MAWRRGLLLAGIGMMLSAPSLAQSLDIDKIAGVYKKQFKNGNISGDKYDSEDILEIVRITATSAYVRTHLDFFNGHVCDFWAVAKAEDGALVYRATRPNVQDKLCLMRVHVKDGKIALEDQDGACAIGTCGNRGMYNGTVFGLKKRRPIRYLKVLLESDQYKDAVDESEGKPRTRRP